MTHYNQHYSGSDTAEDREKALADIKEWLGDTRWNFLSENLPLRPGMTFPLFVLMMSFAGIQGYPVGVWWRDLFNAEPLWDTLP